MTIFRSFEPGQHVEWDWGNGTGTGQIDERFERKVTRVIKNARTTRKGSLEDPAYLVRQADGDIVLKLGSELRAIG